MSAGDEISTERWARINTLFHAAIARPLEERDVFLRDASPEDTLIRDQVQRLLHAHEHARDHIRATRFAGLLAEAGDEVHESLIGARIGAYAITALLGRGGMGAVYLGERADGQFDKRVAVKLSARVLDGPLRDQFARERRMVAALEHPNIARLLDGGTTDDGIPYFVMEYVDGVPFDRTSATLEARLRMFLAVCEAVVHAHRNLVVHGDLKPANVLVTREGTPKLVDFGIGRSVAGRHGDEATPAPFLAMTPQYASPEQMAGKAPTTASDQYSLGVMLFELITGRLPEAAPGTLDREGQWRTRDPGFQEAADLEYVVRRALAHDPAARYPSVGHLADDVRRYLEGLPVDAHPPSRTYRAWMFVRRNRTGVAAAAALAIALLAATVVAWRQARAAEQARAIAEHRFSQVRTLANSVLFDYHDAIRDLAGATPVRERLVRDGLKYLEGLAKDAGNDLTLRREVAAAYERVGELQGGSLSANLGDAAGARDSLQQAVTLRAGIVASSERPTAADRRALAVAQRRLAVIERELGGTGIVRSLLLTAVATLADLAREGPSDTDVLLDLVATRNSLATTLHETGDLDEALRVLEQARADMDRLTPRDRAAGAWRRERSIWADNVGAIHITAGRYADALVAVRESLAIRRALAAEAPSNADYQRIVSVALYNEGEVLAHLGQFEDALGSYSADVAICERLLTVDPRNEQYRGDLAYALVRVGDMLVKLGRAADAVIEYRRSADLRRADVDADATNVLKRASLIEAHAKLADALSLVDRHADAAQQGAIAQRLIGDTTVEPTDHLVRSFLADTWMGLAEVAARSGREDATRFRVRAVEIWRDLRQRGILSPVDARKLQAAGGP